MYRTCKESYTVLYLHSERMPGRYDKLALVGNALCSFATCIVGYTASLLRLAHACCISCDNTILVLKLCVLVPSYFQAFLAMCTVGCALAGVNFVKIPQKFDHTSSLFF